MNINTCHDEQVPVLPNCCDSGELRFAYSTLYRIPFCNISCFELTEKTLLGDASTGILFADKLTNSTIDPCTHSGHIWNPSFHLLMSRLAWVCWFLWQYNICMYVCMYTCRDGQITTSSLEPSSWRCFRHTQAVDINQKFISVIFLAQIRRWISGSKRDAGPGIPGQGTAFQRHCCSTRCAVQSRFNLVQIESRTIPAHVVYGSRHRFT